MTIWPLVDRKPVLLTTLHGHDHRLWNVLVELTAQMPGEWTLIGGQMTYVHALEHNQTPPRVSTDLDVLVNARVAAGGTAAFAAALVERGFEMEGSTPDGIAHRYHRAGVSVDVLAPEGLGPRADLTTTPPNRTVCVPGGTQALARTQLVPVRTENRQGLVPRPSILGAVVLKAAAVGVDDVPDAQRSDLVFLLSLIEDPLGIADHLTPKDKERLRRRSELLSSSHPAWSSLAPALSDRARAAFRLLCA